MVQIPSPNHVLWCNICFCLGDFTGCMEGYHGSKCRWHVERMVDGILWPASVNLACRGRKS